MAVLLEPVVPDNLATQRAKSFSQQVSWSQSLSFHALLDDEVCKYNYSGDGTDDMPYIMEYLPKDHEDAMGFSTGRKWAIAVSQSFAAFAVTFASSAYASGIEGVMNGFGVSEEVATLGLSLYVLGFALGPLIWAPLSEQYGRKSIFLISHTGYTVLSVAAIFAPNDTALLVLRFFASAFGSSTLTNTGAVIADMFRKEERGLATGLFVTAPFLGPALGPIAGGFLDETRGWRWILRLNAILGGVTLATAILTTYETYGPFILRRRATALSRKTGSVFVSIMDIGKPPQKLLRELSVSLTRPWIFLFYEPIVLLTSIYISIIYGTLYMLFSAFPLVFQVARGWSQGTAGLPFAGVAVGVLLATLAAGVDNKRYVRICLEAKSKGHAVMPEARLRIAMAGAVILPIGLFLFAWTTYPWVHWILSVLGATLFGCGLVMVFISLISYLVDTYVIYAASVSAANSVLRSLFGTAFPLFTTYIYESLGNQWASSIPAFLALGCLPVPFLLNKYGPWIRSKCRYASEAAEVLEKINRPQMDSTGDGINEVLEL
ncbi:MFS transporter [Xylariaceae sp. FL0255]|nr:MFS transporter [Xylariaceae sp. FL0255]